jgi:hypothetical protein
MIRLGVAVIVAVILYSGAWYYCAGKAKSWLETALAGADNRPFHIGCQALDIAGYPFRIGAFCSAVTLDSASKGLSASTGAVRSAAQIYNPGHAIVEIDGPANLRTSDGLMAHASWQQLRSSVIAGFSGLTRMSVESNDVQFEALGGLLAHPMSASFQHGELHLRQNGDDLDSATDIAGLTVTTPLLAVALPLADVKTDVTFAKIGDVLQGKTYPGLRGSVGTVLQAALDFGDKGSLALSGPFDIDENGLLSGSFNLSLSRIDELQTVLSASFPDAADAIRQIGQVLSGFSGGSGSATIKLSIRKGIVSVAFFELGRIPPV